MFCIIFIDVSNRLFHRRNHFNRKNIIQIFFAPVFFCCVYSSRDQRISRFICADLHMFLLQTLCKDWKQGILYIFMYKNRFAGIADAYSLSLGIHDNVCCHLKVCGFIHINMAVSSTGLNHRDGALLHYGFDQASAASRDEYIHILVHLHEFCCCLSGCIRNQLDRILCHALFIQSFPDTVYNGLVGMDRITSTLQDYYITCLKAECKCIRSYIRSCFIDNSDHAKRYSLLPDQQSVWAFFHPGYFPDRIIQG